MNSWRYCLREKRKKSIQTKEIQRKQVKHSTRTSDKKSYFFFLLCYFVDLQRLSSSSVCNFFPSQEEKWYILSNIWEVCFVLVVQCFLLLLAPEMRTCRHMVSPSDYICFSLFFSLTCRIHFKSNIISWGEQMELWVCEDVYFWHVCVCICVCVCR